MIQHHSKEEFDANTIMKMLVYSRLLSPASKKYSFDNREQFFEKTDYSLDDVYRCLSFFAKHKNSLPVWLNNKIKEHYGRDTSLIYYDVTNYYFESDEQNDFLRKGVSKEHRPNPIVQMGFLLPMNFFLEIPTIASPIVQTLDESKRNLILDVSFLLPTKV